MATWEYARLQYLNDRRQFKASTLLVFFGADNSQKDVNIVSAIAELGVAGWEMVSHAVVIDKDEIQVDSWFFKRPIE